MNTIACVIDVNEINDQPLLDTLKNVLRASRMLLIVDNFEHLLPAATQISELLSAVPGLKLLATSREPLHLYGEQEYLVSPLALPDPAHLDPTTLANCESVALFLQQARTVRPDFAITHENALDIAKICLRLEGLPLAIELAAARIKLLSPQTLLARLDSRLGTLTGGARDMPARQQTLHNTIEWSYNLLNDGEKMLFAQLAVFRDGFSLEAVESVFQEGYNDILPIDVFDGLASLVNKSLIQQKELAGGEPRFTMLETLHEFAWEQLKAADLQTEINYRHSIYYLEMIPRYETALYGEKFKMTVSTLWHDLDNIRQAWQWTIEQLTSGNVATRQRLAAVFNETIDGLAAFYQVANLLEEGQGVFARAAQEVALGGQELVVVHCHLLARLAEVAEWRGEVAQAYTAAAQVLQLAEQSNQPSSGMQRHRADALRTLGILDRESGTTEQAIRNLQEAIAIYRSLDVKRPLAIAYDWLGLISSDLGRVGEAMDYLEQAAALYAEEGNERGIVFNKGMTAVVLSVAGRLAESLAYQRQVLAGYQKLDYPIGAAQTANNIGLILMELGEFEEAVAQFEYSVQIKQQLGNISGFYNSLGNQGEVYLKLDAYDEALSCFERAGQFFHAVGKGWLECENLWRLAWLLVNQGEYGQAQTALQACLLLAPKDENPEAFAIAHGLLGEIARRQGDFQEALAHFNQSTEAFQAVRRHLTVGRFAIVLKATLYLELGEIRVAETILNDVWPLLGEAGRNPIVFESHLLQARITAAYGNELEARQLLEKLFLTDIRSAEQAAVHYEIWRLYSDEEHGIEAFNIYQQLASRSSNINYRNNLNNLQASMLKRPA